jgi:hypothetical protein
MFVMEFVIEICNDPEMECELKIDLKPGFGFYFVNYY